MELKQCYIANARLLEAPQVRICSKIEPFISLDSCIKWCEKHTFSWVIKDWETEKILAKQNNMKYL